MTQLSFDEKLKNYAKILAVHGLNIEPGEFVQINFGPYAEELATLVGEYAYELGARHVHLAYSSPRITYAQLIHGSDADKFFFPPYVHSRRENIVDSEGCFLSLRTNSEPDLFNSIPELSVKHRNAESQMLKRFRDEGINQGKVAWCVACPASPKEALKVYPDLSLEEAHKKYWDAIFRMTFADQPDCLERWRNMGALLLERRKKLDALKIRFLEYNGPGTDLRVGLAPESVWCGGSSVTAKGKRFQANIPSFEVFTTPDWRKTNGMVKITRPTIVSGILVEDLMLEFKDGVITYGSALNGWKTYEFYINTDEGARRLGEVALVGLDSPIAKESTLLRQILYTENAACHIATGSGHAKGIRNGQKMSKEELAKLGRNDSATHLDVMISDKDVDVVAITREGRAVPLLEKGHWVRQFA
ncbi:hypothetical protein A2673_01535 [Candidatus Kaiserbacteria bacterium RIFCSPHIGHO2_01_FULL_50_13]|uniref:Aminopeptidase n=1 Tax=Candidatus Kaiserbacteria bacterium RIFCSPLOWO2_01_FULL_50_24 TaxID=1798507 RepID=A0A1F6EMF0_9BACT|nr:MAG: hypothetical protein A2673_01535 [Candidatus Kaiserbacteria bacterium RIFCSPHIGHO2_01_FULL_50_13]OGG74805.1 MAG: hypothetical protein A3A34_00235 [Candidatus Kaiserbacteria bacterium RIFCSPLOWO2_01_FULL_50_24]OGG81388.1 MAG: hypothetical protein A3H74_03020 [Candidatus Kaiserbacteria bacterium RIFCSPLOWO2_02_FULL_51_13]